MSIERVIETIGLPACELREFLDREITEFLEAETAAAQQREWSDVLFALKALCFAHTGRHLPLGQDGFIAKICSRLSRYATISRHEPWLGEPAIASLEFGVIHFAFGQLKRKHTGNGKPLKNGTTAELVRLLDNPFRSKGHFAPHLVVTFDDVDRLEFSTLDRPVAGDSSPAVVCRIPDFMYEQARRQLTFAALEPYLALQVLAALNLVKLEDDAILHFHSWETGLLLRSQQFLDRVGRRRRVFSPYLTVGRLRRFLHERPCEDATLSGELVEHAADYEQRLVEQSDRVIVESDLDRSFYSTWTAVERLHMVSFAPRSRTEIPFNASQQGRLSFVAGGRPVAEKGFIELCDQFVPLVRWGQEQGIKVELLILCREVDSEKGARYVGRLEGAIASTPELHGCVRIEVRGPIAKLKAHIRDATALIVPSLYDPFCLMPLYALEEGTVSFVSRSAGVSQNILTDDYLFDPLHPGDLLRAVQHCHRLRTPFVYEARGRDHSEVYLEEAWS